MKTVSESYATSMSNQYRNRSHVKMRINSGGNEYQFLDSDIASIQKATDVDPLTRRLPKETLSFSIFDYEGSYNPSNPSGKWNVLDENAKITIQFGYELTPNNIEWLEPDYYLLSGRPTFNGGVATFQASTKLNHLTKNYYKGSYGTKSFYELAVDVLEDAGVDNYSIDATLMDMYTNAPMPITTHANCLQLIAHATRCTLRTGSNGVIQIKPFSFAQTPDEFYLPLSSTAINGDTISKIETLHKVQCNLYIYTVADSESTLFESLIEVDGETDVHIEYDASTDQVITSDGGEITNVHTYASAADFTLIGSGTYTVTVVGKKINTSTRMVESYISADPNGANDVEKNTLITDSTMQSDLIYHVANYLQYRLTHTVKYRGNPELDCLDKIYMDTVYNSFISALVLTQSISFNGAITGTMVLKSLTEIDNVYLYDSSNTLVEDVNGDPIGIVGTEDYISEYSLEDIDSFIEEVVG